MAPHYNIIATWKVLMFNVHCLGELVFLVTMKMIVNGVIQSSVLVLDYTLGNCRAGTSIGKTTKSHLDIFLFSKQR